MHERDYSPEVLLQDGGPVRIRPVTPADKDRLVDLFGRLSARSVYFRFFRHKERLTDGELAQFTELDFTRNVALAAAVCEDGKERIIAVGRYSAAAPDNPRRAEVNFAVADAYQGHGLGKLLLHHLVLVARNCGITEFEAYVLPENRQMLKVFAASGFEVSQEIESGVIHVCFDIS